MQPFQRAKSFNLSQTYLYQKDERALPGNHQNRRKKMFLVPPLNVVSLITSQRFLSPPFSGGGGLCPNCTLHSDNLTPYLLFKGSDVALCWRQPRPHHTSTASDGHLPRNWFLFPTGSCTPSRELQGQ
jgi:hypothetical protein